MAIDTNTKIGLISKALVLCGEKPLNSLSDNRYGATVGANLFEVLYEEELQSNWWRFNTTQKSLSKLTAEPLTDQWQNIFQIPSDCLLPRGIYPVDLQYEIFGDHLYTDRETVDLIYQFKPEVTAVPAYFSKLMVYALAANMIKPITESDQAVKLMEDKYNMQRSRALYADAQGRPAKPVAHNPFTSVRGGR